MRLSVPEVCLIGRNIQEVPGVVVFLSRRRKSELLAQLPLLWNRVTLIPLENLLVELSLSLHVLQCVVHPIGRQEGVS